MEAQTPRLFVANLAPKVTKEDLQEKFGEFGKITDVRIKDAREVFAFVEYENLEDAQNALEKMNKTEFLGREIRVEFAKGKRNNDRDGGRDFRNRSFGDRRGGERRFERRSRSRSGERNRSSGGYDRKYNRGDRDFRDNRNNRDNRDNKFGGDRRGGRSDRSYNDRGNNRDSSDKRERKYSKDSN